MGGSKRGQLLRIAVQHLLHVMGDLAHGIGGSDGLLEGQGEEYLRREGTGEAGGHGWHRREKKQGLSFFTTNSVRLRFCSH